MTSLAVEDIAGQTRRARTARLALRADLIQWGVFTFTMFLVLAPLLPIIYQAFLNGPLYDKRSTLTLQNFHTMAASTELGGVLVNTAIFAVVTTVIAQIVGATFAILIGRTDMPLRRLMNSLMLVPLVVSSMVLAFGWTLSYGPSGFVTLFVQSHLGFKPWNLNSLAGMSVVAATTQAPLAFVYCLAAVAMIDPALEDAARSCGARPLTIFRKVTLPLLIPSIIFGLWAFFELQGNVVGLSTWLSRHLSFIPFFKVTSPPLNASIFIAGLVVGIMIIPIVASICREVFSLAPAGEREAAMALGASRWQMIRTVVLPFARGGMIGAIMLGLGRALEETIAVSIILAGSYKVTHQILQHGGSTISQLIAINFGSGGTLGLHDLLLCGFVLFVLTLVINLAASAIVNRSRSGAGVDL